MKVHMLVSVDVVEGQAGCAKRCELRSDLGRELAANARKGEKLEADASQVAVKLAVAAAQLWDLHLGQNGAPLGQVQVQADPEFGQTMGAGYRIGRRLASHHQARGRQDPVPVRLFDSLID
jgi:hypothetical protein